MTSTVGLASDERRHDFPSAAVAAALARVLPAESVAIESAALLSGGAIQENWELCLEVVGGPQAGLHRWVLRMDAPSRLSVSHTRVQELALLRVASAAGVRVPTPIAGADDDAELGRSFFVMEHVAGTANARRIVREDALVPDRDALVRSIGADMARIHAIRPQSVELPFLARPLQAPARDFVERYRAHLDALPHPVPAFDYGLRWCERNAPSDEPVSLLHRDYRTGNYLVCDGDLAAVLDWEFAGFGNPAEDIGWFFAKCWRFGRDDRHAGGVGSSEAFLEGYASVAGRAPDREVIRFYEIVAHVRWGIIALQQAERHLSGRERSLELALTGRMWSGIAWTMLDLIEGKTT